MAQTVLVVDDEAQIRELLRLYLDRDGFEVLEASTAAQALELALSTDPPIDAVLLDIGLPDRDGIEVLSAIRRSSDVPVLLVTARTEEVDRLLGLGVGADDYITKPFSPREVVARVKTVLRRARPAATPDAALDEVLRFERIEIDPGRRELTVDRAPVAVSTLEFDLLLALASSPGRVYSRAQLLEQVWGYDFFGDPRVVDVHIATVRRHLGDDASSPWCIGTVRGVGYKFLPHSRP